MDFRRSLGEYKERVNELLEEFWRIKVKEWQEKDGRVGELVAHLAEIGKGGKRLRGFLVTVGYGLGKEWQRWEVEAVPEKVWKASVGVELFHLGLLVQDDVMDRDEMRRGVTSLHRRYEDEHEGEAMANLGGDMCFGWAGQLVGELGSEVVKEWGRYFERVVGGQVMDMRRIEEVRDYWQMAELKTGEYTGEMPLVLGWLATGQKRSEGERLFEWGREWGVAFQVWDDVKDGDGLVALWGKAKTIEELWRRKERLLGRVERLGVGEEWEEMLRGMVKRLVVGSVQ